MSFLDRFKIQPKHKSPDPDVRLASVQELGAGAPGPLNEDDVGVLASIAAADADEAIREEVLGRLAGIAASGEPAGAMQALGALTDQKQIATVAKTSPIE